MPPWPQEHAPCARRATARVSFNRKCCDGDHISSGMLCDMFCPSRRAIVASEDGRTVMTAISAKNEALDDLRDLSSDELDAVSGGSWANVFSRVKAAIVGEPDGQN